MKLCDEELKEGHRDTLRRGNASPHPAGGWRHDVYVVVFEADTPAGKAFDVGLLVAILTSVVVVLLESVDEVRAAYGFPLRVAEWFFTLLFTAEYALRLLCVRRPAHYARSFFGVIDLLSILPTFLSLVIPGAQQLLTIRALRLLRLFRIFKLTRFLTEAEALLVSVRSAWSKITVFIATVVILVVIVGSAMSLIEGSGVFNRGPLTDAAGEPIVDDAGAPVIGDRPTPGFDSIPSSMYWAIVTMSTVGYGDIAPVTVPGKAVASLLILIGYSLIIVPTGVLSAEIAGRRRAAEAEAEAEISQDPPDACLRCGRTLPPDAAFCHACGHPVVEKGHG
ncbi:ion transporter [Phycisphaera mikurensis]|uniref:Putative ion channel n=1 Tax=Phycisphaera mikurensis (strain NBRC 102666 / KCTC 22515 / FYK2301M01) TaxID=1142394 RepID=I0IIB6_PHYMF|nr:ion transporter [Phycisphaera mikurensis]MBB6442433.1 voltage-gated potassium channel [Phycisphaera mikurensis]BAM05004.1 putative ion channel [Phycisphaera mikurensis NBRC 102666]